MSALVRKLRSREFIITAEIDPPRGPDITRTLERARELSGLVDALNVTDCPMANIRMSSIAASHLIQSLTGIETIFHLTCRDRNVIGLQSDLLGAAGLGVTNLLVLSGDPPERGNHPAAKPVYDVDTPGLLKMIKSLNNGSTLAGTDLDSGTAFNVAVAANPASPDMAREINRLKEKIDAGANFVQTQPVFDVETVESFEEALSVAGVSLPVLYGILPLKNKDFAVKMANIPGIFIPPKVLQRMEQGGEGEGVQIAVELARSLSRIARGIHLFPMGGVAVARTIATAARDDGDWLASTSTAT